MITFRLLRRYTVETCTIMQKRTFALRGFWVLSLLIILSGCKKNAENPEPDPDPDPIPIRQKDINEIDSRVDGWMYQNKMPGFSLAISKNGKLVYSKGYGAATSGGQSPYTPVSTESQFRIASVSKLVTSAAVMKLVQEGKVKMDDKVFGTGALLGTTYGTQPYKTYVADITVSHLLHHTVGGWGQDDDPAFFDINLDATAVINRTLNNLSLNKQPGTTFAYSNFGYMLLEKIIEKASGKTYVQYINEEIWNKVRAKQSAIAGSKEADRLSKEVYYLGQAGDAPHVYGMNIQRAAGAMGWLSTPEDLLRFVTAIDSSDTRPDILSPQTIKIMATGTPASKGFGWNFGCGWVVEGPEWFWWGSLPGSFAILYRNANGICLAATANSRLQPNPENALARFFDVSNFIAEDHTIPWQDIDQFAD